MHRHGLRQTLGSTLSDYSKPKLSPICFGPRAMALFVEIRRLQVLLLRELELLHMRRLLLLCHQMPVAHYPVPSLPQKLAAQNSNHGRHSAVSDDEQGLYPTFYHLSVLVAPCSLHLERSSSHNSHKAALVNR